MSNKRVLKMIPLRLLELNRRNPRHGSVGDMADEQEVIDYLLDSESILGLAEHILTHGLSDTDILAVTGQSKNAYTVLEGNRRVCALKVLSNPRLAKGVGQQQLYKKLLDNGDAAVPKKVECRIYKSSEDFDVWMDLKHSSNQPAARKNWSSSQKAIYDLSSPDRLATQLLTFARERGMISEKQLKSMPTTTLTRYLSTEEVRDAIGIGSPADLMVHWNEEVFKVRAQTFLNDAMDKTITARKGYDSSQRIDYADALLGRTLPSGRRRIRKLNLIPPHWQKNRGAVSRDGHRNSRAERDRETLIPLKWEGQAYLGTSGPDQKIARVLSELQKIKHTKFPCAVGCLTRQFSELIIRRFLISQGVDMAQRKLQSLHYQYVECERKLGACMTNASEKKLLVPLNLACSNKSSILSPAAQSEWVHGHITPTTEGIKAIWEDFDLLWQKLLELGSP